MIDRYFRFPIPLIFFFHYIFFLAIKKKKRIHLFIFVINVVISNINKKEIVDKSENFCKNEFFFFF